MKANKTQPTAQPLESYLDSIKDDTKQADAAELVKLMTEVTGQPAVLWGTSIVGFGSLHYKYDSGREGDTCTVGFAVRKNALTLYGVLFYVDNKDNVNLAAKLGPHTHGKGCLYIKSLGDVDHSVLRMMIANAYKKRSDLHKT